MVIYQHTFTPIYLAQIHETVLPSLCPFPFQYKQSNCAAYFTPLINITNLSHTKSPTISSSCSILPCYSREYPMALQVLHNPYCLLGSSSRKLHQFDGSNQCTIANCLGLDCRTSRSKETRSNAWCSMLGGQEISTALDSWTCTQVGFHRQGIC